LEWFKFDERIRSNWYDESLICYRAAKILRQGRVRLKILKASVFAILSVLAVLMIAAAAFFWRLNQGPMSLTFLNGRIESAVNDQLKNMQVSLGEAVLELNKKDGVPNVRFRNLVLKDADGTVIASSPRAAVALETSALLSGKIVIKSLDLIGPKISARRNLDGTVVLGVGGQAANADEPVIIEDSFNGSASAAGKGDRVGDAEPPLTSGAKLIALLDARGGKDSLSAIEDIRITNASLNLFDDANAATWFAPNADLTFRKMPYGFVVLAKADVASSGSPWHAEFSASYHHDKHAFNVSTTVDNLVLADVADKIFALSQFAKLKIPLSGHIDFDAGEDGVVSKANAELLASGGQLNFPEYLAQPIVVDDGTLRVNYLATSGAFEIVDSSIRVGGQRADISGRVNPVRSADGKLTSLTIAVKAKNVSLDTQGTDKVPVLVDRVEFIGKAAIEQARLDIDDLVVMSGNTGVRMRGIITGGEESPGIQLAGRVRDISATFLKRMWPPIVAPKSRAWVNEHVVDGRVPEGTFQINLPANALAKAKRDLRLPDNSVDFTFALQNVSTHYFKNMPLLENGEGEAHQHDNNFELTVTAGQSQLESGRTVKVNKGSFTAHDLLLDVVQGTFAFDLVGPIDAMVELASEPDLKLIKTDLSKFPKVQGTVHAAIGLQFPLIKDVPKERVQISTDIAISNAALPDVLPGVDLTDGELKVDVTPEAIAVSGPAKVNGLPAKITWKKLKSGGPPSSEISVTLDEKIRERMGMKLSDYMSGPVPIIASISENEQGQTQLSVDADLSSVKMKLAAVGWKRDAFEGTKSSFKIVTAADGSRKIEDFKLDGQGLALRGNINISANGKLSSVSMDQIRLDEDNVFSARVIPGEGTTDLNITGKNFDARPYIKNLISPIQQTPAATTSASTQDFTLHAHFDRVTANRGEAVDDVTAILRARGGKIASADIQGQFLSGLPVVIKVTPLPTGRDMRVSTSDGGAALRAANFYSKLAGGELEFSALIGNEQGSPVRNGQLSIRNFEVRNEAALAQLDQRGKPTKSGPRKGGISFIRLWLPFNTDGKFVRLGDVSLRGTDMCATASGVIRKADGALEVTGTVVPVCGVSGIFNNVPLIGDILTGGNNNEGIFGMTYGMSGTLAKPNVRVNPISVLAPGLFRRLFDFHNSNRNKRQTGSTTLN
jgi:Protein of unknown function